MFATLYRLPDGSERAELVNDTGRLLELYRLANNPAFRRLASVGLVFPGSGCYNSKRAELLQQAERIGRIPADLLTAAERAAIRDYFRAAGSRLGLLRELKKAGRI